MTYKQKFKLKSGEARGQNMDGVYSVAIRTQQEVAEMLGISKQAVQQIERRAICKIRYRLLPYLTPENV